MQMISVLYVSTSALYPQNADREVDKIIAGARVRNHSLDLTGALLFTGSRFAQVLEGEEADVDEMLRVIIDDARHRDMIVLGRDSIMTRCFAGWDMAYSGPSGFVSGFVSRLVGAASAPDRQQAATNLADLMAKFASS